MSFDSYLAASFNELETAHVDALAYLALAVKQLSHRQTDLRCVEATENAKRAAQCIRRAREILGQRP